MANEQQPAERGIAEARDIDVSMTSIDNPDNWNFEDPDDDQASDEIQNEGTEDGADEIEAEDQDAEQSGQDEDETETDDEADSDEEQPQDDSDEDEPASIKLKTGEEVSLDEVISGYMKGADYTRKTQAVAKRAGELEALNSRLERTVEVFTDFLSKNLPPQPDPGLAYSDPNAYVAQKAYYDQQMGQFEQLLSMAQEPKAVKQDLSDADHQAAIERGNERLAEMFPTIATEKGHKAFFENVFAAGQKLGIDRSVIERTTDPNLLALGYYAKIGMDSLDKAKVAKAKVAVAPKAAPKKQSVQVAGKARENAKAMDRLKKTGSIYDAVHVDWS